MTGGGRFAPPRRLTVEDSRAAADLHAEVMDDAWDEAAWHAFIADPATIALGTRDLGGLAAVVLLRVAADEAEVLTIAVADRARKGGLGRTILSEALSRAARRGAGRVFLEVAVDNAAALALYRGAGFVEIGRRSGYYRRQSGSAGAVAVDALMMSRLVHSADEADEVSIRRAKD